MSLGRRRRRRRRRRHTQRTVLVLVKDLHVRITDSTGQVLRDFHLDPTRDYQPQPKT